MTAMTAAAISRQPEPYADIADWRIVSGPICGSLLGPEWIAGSGDKYFRVGALTASKIKRGISPDSDLDLLECDENGTPIDEAI